MKIYCCGCGKKRGAELVTGKDVYPHRKDLAGLKFWRCETCGNFVGCHKGTTEPLGVIPNQEIKNIRMAIHSVIDPLWKEQGVDRGEIYARISKELGYEYHTANIRTVKEGEKVLELVKQLSLDDFETTTKKRLKACFLLLASMSEKEER